MKPFYFRLPTDEITDMCILPDLAFHFKNNSYIYFCVESVNYFDFVT